MRKSIKKLLAFASAAVLACGACSLAACGTNFTPPSGGPAADALVTSNGGFIVEKGDYYYFINGKETYTSDNTYGKPVKGALMRAKKADVQSGKGDAETVVPSLMVAGSYNGGLFIYGDRVYYATPTNVKDTSGVVQNAFLDFVSAKLDGTAREEHVRVSANNTDYRYIEENGVVYLVYYDSANTALHSFNTKDGTDVVLAEGLTSNPVFHKTDKGNTDIYYTMTVSDGLDSDSPTDYSGNYNQIYRVTAGTTESPYTYEWDKDYLKEHDGEEPYVNLGTLVLDGRGSTLDKTQFNQSKEDPKNNLYGYTYTLRSFENGGIYFTRKQTQTKGALYFLHENVSKADGWDSVSGNEQLEKIASGISADDSQQSATATADALYYYDTVEGKRVHHYIYVDGKNIIRADIKNGDIEKETKIALNAEGATLAFLDPIEEGDTYGYVYYTITTDGNEALYRAVYDNKDHTADDYFYNHLPDAGFADKSNYEECRVLDLVHASDWYGYELIGNDLFFADADSKVNGTSMNYVSRVSLANKEGQLMTNSELKEFDSKLNAIIGYDSKLQKYSLISDISEEMEDDVLANAVKYYFYTGKRDLVDENSKEYKDAVKANEEADGDEEIVDPYTDNVLTKFKDFIDGKDLTYNKHEYKEYETTRSAFVTRLGKMSDADEESAKNYWQTTVLDRYTPPAVEKAHGLAGWKIALIVVACVLALGGAAAAVTVVLLKKKQKENAPKKVRMQVDTTDDRDIDVYATDEVQPESELEEDGELPEEEVPAEEVSEEDAPEAEGEVAPEDDSDPYNE